MGFYHLSSAQVIETVGSGNSENPGKGLMMEPMVANLFIVDHPFYSEV